MRGLGGSFASDRHEAGSGCKKLDRMTGWQVASAKKNIFFVKQLLLVMELDFVLSVCAGCWLGCSS